MNNLRKNVREIVMTTIVAVAAFVVEAAPLAGVGTEADPYRVSSVEDLLDFAESVNAGETVYNDVDVCVALTADLDLAGVEFPGIGTAESCFIGTFDGCDHTVSNLSIENMSEDAWGVGFINFLGDYMDLTAGTLRNVRFTNFKLITHEWYGCSVGIAGECGAGVVENVTVDGSVVVEGACDVSVLVGWADLLAVRNCRVSVDAESYIIGVCRIGGFAGFVGTECEIADSVIDGLTVYGNCDFDGFVGDRFGEVVIVNSEFNGKLQRYYDEDTLEEGREIAAILAEEGGKDCVGFKSDNLDVVKFVDWIMDCCEEVESIEQLLATPHLFEAFAFNLPFDTFAETEPKMSIKYLRDRPEEGWTTIVLCIRAGDRELEVNGINASVFVKHGNSIDQMEEELLPADRIVPFTCDEGGHATVALEVAPPAGSCHFFSVSIR